ncbi:MAG TPA: phosphate ABC transporter substrate-binding protein [Verrucomicrobiales bacterium]|nr:phosphate ABC transporter substrate-binding protein [Verrucomicrobiales bacterium]
MNTIYRRMKAPGLILGMLAALGLGLSGCKRSGTQGGKLTIQNIGSDTMVNLAQAWAEAYQAVEPSVSVEVAGGGSGIGVAALLNGTCEIANSSRHLEEEEIAKAKERYGSDPKEVPVGYDALAIYVHASNPLTEIAIEELSEIYREGGSVNKWSDIGVQIPGVPDEIVRVSRQNNSGTYHYFREAVVGKQADFKQGSRDMNGSKDVVALVEDTPGAIGYSGIGYRTDKVKVLNVSNKKGDPAIEPTVETTLDKTYPIARPMYFYTPPGVDPHVTKYIEWVLGPEGQKIVLDKGYIPLEQN